MPELRQVPFYYLRHGETDWNHQRIMQGTTDIPLNAIGEHQAREIASAVARLPLATVCCSSLQRARRTAEIVNNGRAPIVVIDALKECCFGIYEGQSSAGPWREAWRKGAAIPEGESFDDYVARALGGLNQALAHPAPVLIVAHGGTFWAIERHALAGTQVRIANCVLYKLEPQGSGPWSCTQIAEPATPHIAIGEAAP